MRGVRASVHAQERDDALLNCFKSSPFWKRESFFVYVSYSSEADTGKLIEALKAAGKRVCLPVLTADGMVAAPDTGERRGNRYGIEEPTGEKDEPCEVAITPLLAVDKAGFRLGYGGGYYDKYFAEHASVLRVGLCYEAQICERVPREERDVPLHAVVTEAGVRYFPAADDTNA